MIEDLDLVEEDDQFTHMIHIDGEHKGINRLHQAQNKILF